MAVDAARVGNVVVFRSTDVRKARQFVNKPNKTIIVVSFMVDAFRFAQRTGGYFLIFANQYTGYTASIAYYYSQICTSIKGGSIVVKPEGKLIWFG